MKIRHFAIVAVLALGACAGNPKEVITDDVDVGPAEEKVVVPPVNQVAVQFRNFAKCAGITRALTTDENKEQLAPLTNRFTRLSSNLAKRAGIPEVDAKRLYNDDQRAMRQVLVSGKATPEQAKMAVDLCVQEASKF